MSERRPALLEVDHLVTHFRTERGVVRAVSDVSLTVNRGEALGIVGESGSGKTVLSRSMMGLLSGPEVVRSGSVRFDGYELVGRTDSELRRTWGTNMAMVFQDPAGSLNPLMRVGEQIAEPLRAHLGVSRRDAAQAALELLADVRVPDPERRARQYPHELSGGLRQRVMIAIALACEPQLLFADEPTTALDVTVQAQILALLAEQRRRARHGRHPCHPRSRGRRRTHRSRRRDVRRANRRTGPDPGPVHRRQDAVHGSADRQHPGSRRPTAPAAADDSRTPSRPRRPARRLRVRPRCPYARERCRTETPPLIAADSADHHFACWYPVGSPEHRQRRSDSPVVGR